MDEKRLRLYAFTGRLVASLLITRREFYRTSITDGLPGGAVVIDARWNAGNVEIIVEHEDFDPVPHGAPIPMHCIEIREERED
jgi:hypothetical protein